MNNEKPICVLLDHVAANGTHDAYPPMTPIRLRRASELSFASFGVAAPRHIPCLRLSIRSRPWHPLRARRLFTTVPFTFHSVFGSGRAGHFVEHDTVGATLSLSVPAGRPVEIRSGYRRAAALVPIRAPLALRRRRCGA